MEGQQRGQANSQTANVRIEQAARRGDIPRQNLGFYENWSKWVMRRIGETKARVGAGGSIVLAGLSSMSWFYDVPGQPWTTWQSPGQASDPTAKGAT